MNDLWEGKYLILFPDGSPLAQLDPLDVLMGGYRQAQHPADVLYVDNLDVAKEIAKRVTARSGGVVFTVHRIERLTVLQEKFNY